ncbi:MAG: hypothetical protein AAGC70_15895 [Pseudomonadota bacterium]
MWFVYGVVFALVFAISAVTAQSTKLPAYGTDVDVVFANELWRSLERARLVGPKRISVWPSKGHEPHGNVHQIFATTVIVNRRNARVVVKANHRGEKIKPAGVYVEPTRYLTGYAVMFKRRQGYHPPGKDWFWVVYNTDGSMRNFEGKPIAGRVDTGKENGCIGCHRKWGGADFEALTPN